MDGFPELTIGEVAQRAGVATSSIRYYERIGLLPEPDREGGQRRYDADVLGKLGFIGVAQSAGFKLREIKELIKGVDGADGLGEQMRSLSSQKLDEVEALLERTKAMKGWLEVAKECGCATPAECALFPAPARSPGRRPGSASRPGGRQGLSSSARGLRPCLLPLPRESRSPRRCGRITDWTRVNAAPHWALGPLGATAPTISPQFGEVVLRRRFCSGASRTRTDDLLGAIRGCDSAWEAAFRL